ncbi:MAG: carbon-nitrogen family hydrolase [Lachnospiraceae bacterium]|nr:carbon-nitrogen family hydrolase [Lachnospiraceae bacterium]
MRVALGQLDMVWENKEASILRGEKMIREAAQAKADVIIFPEMSFAGFSMNLDQIGEPVGQSLTRQRMSDLARQYRIAIGYGWAALPEDSEMIRGETRGTNRFTLIDHQGNLVTEYAKIHPFTYGGELERFARGEQIVSVPFLGRNISLFICYDLRFPELFQIASKQSDILFVIANWPGIRSAHWQTLLRARAIETQSYLVGVNCYGSRDGDSYSGDSMAVDSIGNILGILSGREGVLICDLDDRAWSLRQKFSTRADRQEELYGDYFSGKRKVAE